MKDKLEPFNLEKHYKELEYIEPEEALKMSNPVIFDTNFLFVPFEFRIDVITEIKNIISSKISFFIYEGTLDELKTIESKKNKNKRFLPLIIKFLKLYNFKIIKSDIKYIDKQIIEGLNKYAIIATNDSELRKKIWENKCKVIYMRNKKYLEIK